MSQSNPRQISIFIASPGDLAPERKAFKETIDALNEGFADGADVRFVPLGWEDVLAETGRRAQGVINQELAGCDIFILALHRRWGQDAADSKYSSYTEEEFEIARQRWKNTNSPEVLVFFKNVDAASIADPGRELKKVLKFRKSLQREKLTLFKTFNSESEFANEVDRHLRAYAKGEFEKLDQAVPTVELPKNQVAILDKAERKGARRVKRAEDRVSSSRSLTGKKGKRAAVAKADLSLVQSYQSELTLARLAAEAADEKRIQDATILFSKATEGTTDLSILALAAEFFRQVGDVENATRLVRRQAAIARDREIAYQHLVALLPENWLTSQRAQIQALMLQALPPEMADVLEYVNEEIWGEGRFEDYMRQTYIKNFTVGELMHFARSLGTAEGQSSLHKQQQIAADLLSFVGKEVDRVLEKVRKQVEKLQKLKEAELPEMPEPKRLSTGGDENPARAKRSGRKKHTD